MQRRYGDVGVGLVRVVLADRRPLEATARAAGAIAEREVRSWSWLFRKCLDAIALAIGFVSGTRRPLPVSVNGADDADPARHCRRRRARRSAAAVGASAERWSKEWGRSLGWSEFRYHYVSRSNTTWSGNIFELLATITADGLVGAVLDSDSPEMVPGRGRPPKKAR